MTRLPASTRRASLRPAILGVVVLASLGLGACSKEAEKQAKDGRPVLVATVHYEPLVPERSFVGTVRPQVESDLGFRVTGKVARRLVQAGDAVKAGQALAVLDEADLKLQLDQAEAEQRAAASSREQAQASETRAVELRKKGWSTQAQLDAARAAADEARSRLSRAERAVELARNNLSYATLDADADGIVTATIIEPGQVIAAGQAAVRVAVSAARDVAVAIPEGMVERARQGKASVSLWSEAGRTYAASLRELAPAADPATRTYLAKFALPADASAARLGMTATLTLADAAGEKAARVPLSALFSQDSQTSLYIVGADGSLTLKPVTVKAYEARDALITGGVAEGEQVVAMGVHKLDTAQKARVVQALSF
jgi:RND family efflux transporter MFP subunit